MEWFDLTEVDSVLKGDGEHVYTGFIFASVLPGLPYTQLTFSSSF